MLESNPQSVMKQIRNVSRKGCKANRKLVFKRTQKRFADKHIANRKHRLNETITGLYESYMNKRFSVVLQSKTQTVYEINYKRFAEVLESKSQTRFQNPFLQIVLQSDQMLQIESVLRVKIVEAGKPDQKKRYNINDVKENIQTIQTRNGNETMESRRISFLNS